MFSDKKHNSLVVLYILLFLIMSLVVLPNPASALGTPRIVRIDPPSPSPVGTAVTIEVEVNWDNEFRSMRMRFGNGGWEEESTTRFSRTFTTDNLSPGWHTIRVEVVQWGDNDWMHPTFVETSYQLTGAAKAQTPSCNVDSMSVSPTSGVVGTSFSISASGSCNTNVRALRLKVDGAVFYEIGAPSASAAWNSTGASVRTHTATVEVAGLGDNDWRYAASRSVQFTVTDPSKVPDNYSSWFSDGNIIDIGGNIFVIYNNQRRHIPNPETLDALGIPRSWIDNKGLNNSQLETIPRGADVPDVNRDPEGFKQFKNAVFPHTVPIIPGDTPPTGQSEIGYEAIWDGTNAISFQDCPQPHVECVIALMQSAGASRQAIMFTQLLQGDAYMSEFTELGVVDLAAILYPTRANDNFQHVLVNGLPEVIHVEDVWDIDITQDPNYPTLIQRFPDLILWSSHNTFQAIERLADGGQRIIFRYDLMNGCHACGVVGYATIAFDFDSTGRLLRARLLSLTQDNVSIAPEGYTFCANENERCTFSGTKDVAYGVNGQFNYKSGVTGGTDCNNSVFGDPSVGVGKACYIRDATSTAQLPANSGCPGAPKQQMTVGQQGRVTFTDGSPTSLRAYPSVNSQKLMAMSEGYAFKVIGGPVCAEGYSWWNLQTADGIIGWSAEGDNSSYFIEPLPFPSTDKIVDHRINFLENGSNFVFMFDTRTYEILNGADFVISELRRIEWVMTAISVHEEKVWFFINYAAPIWGEVEDIKERIKNELCNLVNDTNRETCREYIKYRIGSEYMDLSGLGNIAYGYFATSLGFSLYFQQTIASLTQVLSSLRVEGRLNIPFEDNPDDLRQREVGIILFNQGLTIDDLVSIAQINNLDLE